MNSEPGGGPGKSSPGEAPGDGRSRSRGTRILSGTVAEAPAGSEASPRERETGWTGNLPPSCRRQKLGGSFLPLSTGRRFRSQIIHIYYNY